MLNRCQPLGLSTAINPPKRKDLLKGSAWSLYTQALLWREVDGDGRKGVDGEEDRF